MWFSELKNKNYTLNVGRVSNFPNVKLPSNNLEESDYVPMEKTTQYQISFRENEKIVEIRPNFVRGKKRSAEGFLVYELNEGLFAGGRLIIWKSDKAYEAEYTVYGTGVPVIKSERGKLEQTVKTEGSCQNE